jgi:hypothetical protein
MFNTEEKQLLDKLAEIDNIDGEIRNILNKTTKNLQEIKKYKRDINKLIEEKTKGFPWLADAISQYHELRDSKISEFLERKLRPALSSAERVREIAKEKRISEKKFRVTRNLIKYYETLFPWLPEFVGEDIDELVESLTQENSRGISQDDPVKFYLTKGEYEKLSVTERNQKALDRYWSKKKSSWELGRDYERYVGYLYENAGFRVYYQGIEAGLEDLGRDLIAKRNGEVKVIQCKYWSQYKTIHEKHICQLFGTTLKYWLEQKKILRKRQKQFLASLVKKDKISGVFVTSTNLSDIAKDFAVELGIQVKDKFPLEEYPSIKCNISKRTGEKIYHLPMDQQYDRTLVEKDRDECYVGTVADAEKLGFRRAWRWSGG